MTAPLFTRDADALRQLARPRWQRRVMAWTLPVAATALALAHSASVGSAVCSDHVPCTPDSAGAVYVGLLFAAAFAGFIYPRLASWFAGAFLVTMIVSERLVGEDLVSPAWLYIVDLAFVGLCVLLGGVSRDRQPSDQALLFLAGVRRERPPARADLPRPGQGVRLAGWALAVTAVACLAWGWYAQQRADVRQQAAERVAAEVIAHPDEFTLEVRLPGQTARIGVLDARAYPIGTSLDVYVDGRGLRQPVAEPYDASGWLFLGVLLACVAFALRKRGVDIGHAPRRLFTEAQPVTEVSVLPDHHEIAVYAGDARPGESPIFVIRLRALTVVDDTNGFHVTGPNLEPRLQPATLYGIPSAGQWCAIVAGGELVVPDRPISTDRSGGPPYGYDEDDDDSPWDDPDPPLRAEQVEALRVADREAGSDEVRFHARSPAVGYLCAGAGPLAFSQLVRLLPELPYGVALLIAGAGLAVSCAIAWRVLMRGRIAWNGRGFAVIGVVGEQRAGWHTVRDIEYDRDSVTIHTSSNSLTVSAGTLLGIIGRRERGPEELANALRHARNTAAVTGHPAGMPGDGSEADLPHLDRPRPPLGLWALWLVGTPALAWFLQGL